jgi:lysylphosphatidylglycerol synthetase-like protein (DUF2156 family)
VLRFFGVSAVVAAGLIGAAAVMQRRGASLARALYTRAIVPYALVVLLIAVGTSFFLR